MTMTIAAVMYSSVVSKPENTLAKSAKYPPGPVTYACRSPALSWAIERICSTLGVSCCQPLPSELNLMGTTTCVDSAFFGSQDDASFFWALLSLPESGPATTNTKIQNARTNHFVQRPHGKLAILCALPMTPPVPRARHPPQMTANRRPW